MKSPISPMLFHQEPKRSSSNGAAAAGAAGADEACEIRRLDIFGDVQR